MDKTWGNDLTLRASLIPDVHVNLVCQSYFEMGDLRQVLGSSETETCRYRPWRLKDCECIRRRWNTTGHIEWDRRDKETPSSQLLACSGKLFKIEQFTWTKGTDSRSATPRLGLEFLPYRLACPILPASTRADIHRVAVGDRPWQEMLVSSSMNRL